MVTTQAYFHFSFFYFKSRQLSVHFSCPPSILFGSGRDSRDQYSYLGFCPTAFLMRLAPLLHQYCRPRLLMQLDSSLQSSSSGRIAKRAFSSSGRNSAAAATAMRPAKQPRLQEMPDSLTSSQGSGRRTSKPRGASFGVKHQGVRRGGHATGSGESSRRQTGKQLPSLDGPLRDEAFIRTLCDPSLMGRLKLAYTENPKSTVTNYMTLVCDSKPVYVSQRAYLPNSSEPVWR
jgi:hypothetical protein